MTSQQGRGPKMLVCLCCLGAPQHASIPVVACWHASMPVDGQRPARQGAKNAWMSVVFACPIVPVTGLLYSTRRISLEVPRSMAMGGHRPECQHASMPACYNRVAGMPGCTPAAQTDKYSSPADHRPACQHASMPPTWVLVCL